MGARIREFDWSRTPLGPAESWSPALRTTVRLMLANRLPMLLWWGPQYVSLYNDPYRPVLGNKHPRALGQPVHECWQEIWHVLKPLIDTPFHGGPATWDEDLQVEINRHGFLEETHFTIAYSPVPDESVPSGIGGVLATVHEITEKVIGERRMVALRDLGTRPAEARTAEQACAVAALTLATHARDVPFALIYLIDADGRHARLAATAGVTPGESISPQLVDLGADDAGGWPLPAVSRTGQARVVADLGSRFPAVPPGPWSDPPTTAVVLPVLSSKRHDLAGFFLAGVSSRLRLDDAYWGFLDLATAQIATAVATARAYAEEKRRAEALAELDRAKTAFFNNVSHEFRTPLTLILGPVEELLGKASPELPAASAALVAVVQRNGLRLLRLVNTLLDFARIEAGRVRVVYQPTDLAALTADLASVFRSAVERAGLQLLVDCPKVSEPVYVDPATWEKVVLNLLSNAFKFTLEGTITVRLRQVPGAVELQVRDTGTGIPAAELPRIFERFHRVENPRGRTYEGSGIGLALVQELVKLHGGTIRAESTEGQGTTFFVTVPLGTAHLPPGQIGEPRDVVSAMLVAAPYVEEALRWLPVEQAASLLLPDEQAGSSLYERRASSVARPRVLVADDNADMRQYLSGLLATEYEVQTTADGTSALQAALAHPPDLILTDVMMPQLDGFGLLRSLRGDPRTSALPVILLSARAGEESRVEGMQAGADDYLVKPFSARELLARVGAHLQMARMRREAGESLRLSEERLRMALSAARMVAWQWDAATDQVVTSDNLAEIYGLPPGTTVASGQPALTLIHPKDRDRHWAIVQKAIAECGGYFSQFRIVRPDTGAIVWLEERGQAARVGPAGSIRLIGVVMDVTDRKQAEAAARANAERFRLAAEAVNGIIYEYDVDRATVERTRGLYEVLGYRNDEVPATADWWWQQLHPDDLEANRRQFEAPQGKPVLREYRVRHKDGRWLHVEDRAVVMRDETGRPKKMIGCTIDVTERKRAEAALKEADRRKDEFLATLAHELRNPLAPLRNGLQIMELAREDPEAVARAREMMERQLGQMVRLIDDLLDVNRISRGKVELKKERLDLARAIRGAVETSRPLFNSAGHHLAVELPREPIWVDADLTRLSQVFANLLNNAAKYTERGGRVRLSAERRGGEVIVLVQDTGIGIPRDMLTKVFDMFAQVDRSLEKSQGGLGLGLSIVRGLVELHGGSVEAKSGGPGKGSEFLVRLPVAASPLPQKPRADAPPSPAARRRILVVDDNRDAAVSLAMMLRLMGNDTKTAYDGLEALETASAYRPDVILLDLGMPGLNGYDAARRIREQPWGTAVVLVALTGWGQEADRRRSSEVGFDHHLVKPVEPAALETLLANLPSGVRSHG